MDCSHDDIEDGICQDCGLIIEDGYAEAECAETTGSRAHSYAVDLMTLNIPEEVKEMVLKMSQPVGRSSVRRAAHKKYLYAYIYIAYVSLNLSFDAENIRKQIGLTLSEKNEAIRIASGISGNGRHLSVHIPIGVTEVSQCMEEEAAKVAKLHTFTPFQLQRLKEFADTLTKSYPSLYDENPRILSAGILKIFIEKNCVTVREFEKLVELTPICLKGAIAKIYEAIPYIEIPSHLMSSSPEV